MKVQESIALYLQELEVSLTLPSVRRSASELEALIADEFQEFGASGKVYNKSEIIEGLLKEIPCTINAWRFNALGLAENVVLLTYQGSKSDLDGGRSRSSLRSSIWRRERGQWQIVFHQGTPLPVPEPDPQPT